MKKRIIPIVLVLAIAGMAGYFWWQSSGGSANGELGGSGTIEAQQIALTPQTSGRIIAAPAEEGVAVKAGQVLYTLDRTLLELQVKNAQAAVSAAWSNYSHVRKDKDSSRADKDAAKAQYDQAGVALKMNQVQLGYTQIASPIDGTLSNIAQKAGENAMPGTTLAMISQVQSLTVTIYIPEDKIGQVKMGQTGQLTTDSTKDKAYSARVSFIASQAEFTPSSIETKDQRVKLVYQVKLDITDADAQLKPGMPADVVLK